ncbi:MAG: Swt1 family HEPN domain-containing protein [Microbacterium sp.]
MATNRELKTALLEKLGVTPQRLSQRVAQVKRLYGPMSTEDGTYVLAHQEGVDLTRYVDQATVDRVRGLLPGKAGTTTPAANPAKRTRAATSSSAVRIAPSLELVDAMLPRALLESANRMANVYPKLYVFENSIRNVIVRVLSAKHGSDWWAATAPTGVQKRVATRKDQEAKKPWHGKRGTGEIYYSDFGDLRDLITSNWSEFEPIFLKQAWITQRLDELEPPRNIVAHNNPLSKNEENRVDLYFNDWIALLNDRREFVP